MALFNKQSPGVYIEEGSGPRPISSPSTAILAVVGLCRREFLQEPRYKDKKYPDAKADAQRKQPTTKVTKITSWPKFTDEYGTLADNHIVPGGYLHETMFAFFMNGGTTAYVVGIPVAEVNENWTEQAEESVKRVLPAATTINDTNGQPLLTIATRQPLTETEDVTLEFKSGADDTFSVTFRPKGGRPKTIGSLSLKEDSDRFVSKVMLLESNNLLDARLLADPAAPLALPDKPVSLNPQAKETAPTNAPPFKLDGDVLTAFKGDFNTRAGILGLEAYPDITLVIAPDVMACHRYGMATDDQVIEIQQTMLSHCSLMQDRFAILDCPKGKNPQQMEEWRQQTKFSSAFGALYYPWVKANNKLLPPSGFVAGVYSRVDTTRGVHKAPANEVVNGAIGLEYEVSDREQAGLNPISVNVIRAFRNRGIRIWGARTLDDPASEWRYINVRRLFSNIEEAIFEGTQWTVFEPNDRVLWAGIRREVSAYLTLRWREGALFGATPEEAFYVICDETINDEPVRNAGYCLVEVGIAPVKPAEFVVFTIRHKQDAAD